MSITEKRVPPSIGGFSFVSFATWLHVRHAAETNVTLFYWAPLDTVPRPVLARRVFKNGKVRIDAGEVCFTADEGHLGRFYRRERERPVEWDTDRPCAKCGKGVPMERRCYAVPHCHECLPPPEPIGVLKREEAV